jgi:putative N6-adenine-specific DNA methylase
MVKNAVALCAVGAEKIVSNELRKLGLKVLEGGFGQIKFQTDLAGLYRTLIGLRAADRVLLECSFFNAADFDALFEGTKAVPWEDLIPPTFGLKVAKVRTNRSALSAETSIQAVVHKAAAERLCEKRKINRLPEHGDEAELRVHIEKDNVSLQLDLSGEPLFRRGYRTRGGAAPLRETTAVAIILHSLWKRKYSLYDPFCGSGTIAIEAAMYAWNIAPGLGRHFSLERLLPADKNIERKVREEFLSAIDFSKPVRIAGSDSDTGAIASAKGNTGRAIAALADGISRNGDLSPALPSFRVLSMEDAFPPEEFDIEESGEGFIITNPPYGRRLGDPESAERTYAEMAKLSRHFPGWKLVLITDHPGFESFYVRKADSCREITNGAIRSYMYQYEHI